MSRKKYLIGAGIAAVLIAVFVLGHSYLGQNQEKGNQQEMQARESGDSEESTIEEPYGEDGFLGPMAEDVDALTKEELEEINPEAVWNEEPVSELEGRYNKLPVNSIEAARRLLYSVSHLLGIDPDENTFLYGGEFEDTETGSVTYKFTQMYQGVMVPEGFVQVQVDDKGNTKNIFSRFKSKEEIGMESTEPKVSEQELVAIFKEQFEEYVLTGNQLYILTSLEGKMRLIWVVHAQSFLGEQNIIHIDANTGEEIVYHQENSEGKSISVGVISSEEQPEDIVNVKEDPKDSWPEMVRILVASSEPLTKYETITYEQLLEWNPDEPPEIYLGNNYELSRLRGRFTEKPIVSEEDVIEAVWSVGHWIDMFEEYDSYEVCRTEEREGGKVYYLQQYYRGLRVADGGITIAVDEKGYGTYLSSNYTPYYLEENMAPEHEAEELVRNWYGDELEIISKELILCEYDLAWDVKIVADGVQLYVIVGDNSNSGMLLYMGEEPYRANY